MTICRKCGAQASDESKFCPNCGANIQELQPSAQPPAAQQPPVQVPPAQMPYSPQPTIVPPAQPRAFTPHSAMPPRAQTPPVQPYTQRPPIQQAAWQTPPAVNQPAQYSTAQRKNAIIPIAIAVGAVIILAIVFMLTRGKGTSLPAVSYSYINEDVDPEIQYTITDTVFPSLYRTLDSLVSLTATCECGTRDVLVKVEVPGFSQSYEQKMTLSPQITKINIRPPMLTGDINLNTEKDAQLVLSVTDVESGKTLVQDSKNIRIMSKYDVVWWTEEYKDSNNDNILAWMTPDSPSVLKLKRDAVDYLSYVTNGELNSIVGYQDYGYDDITDNTWVQAVAIMGAMSDYDYIRYNNASFSISSDVQQRVMLPDDVMKSQSGICIETSLLVASALQSAGMHTMLIFPPGHAQVAVETWPNTGDYFLIETTMLPMPANKDGFNKAVQLLSKQEWQGYIDGTGSYTLGQCYVLDCELGKKLSILPMSN